jgi:TrmH family RNA methyltransferase
LSDGKRRLLGRLQRRKTREREGLVLVEGVRAVLEALGGGARPRFLLRSPRSEALLGPELEAATQGLECLTVTHGEMAEVAGTESPQGVLLVAEEPRPDPGSVWDAPVPRVLVLDGIQDPGNVGTLIRAAAAFGCTGVAALDGTADAWGARAVRAAAGTTFRLPVVHLPWHEFEEALRTRRVPLVVADAGGADIRAVNAPPNWALAVGGEGAGCRPEVRARSDYVVSVAMPGGVESLNVGVAGAILLHELSQEPVA